MNKKLKNKIIYEVKCTINMLIAVLISCLSLYVFVIPADFSPSGIDGVSTILYEITNINIGWFKIIINLPLLVLALIFLNKRYVLYISIFTILDSVGVILLDKFNFYTFIPANVVGADVVGYRLIAAIFAGVALGVTSGIMLKMGLSTGGVDIIASIIHKKHPHIHTERVISIMCYSVIICSYFVYWDILSILLSIIQIFLFEVTTYSILKGDRYAVEVKIVTKHPEQLKEIILNKYEHSATIIPAKGMYTNDDTFMIITIMTEREVEEFRHIIKDYEGTFLYYAGGVQVIGDFEFNEHNIKV